MVDLLNGPMPWRLSPELGYKEPKTCQGRSQDFSKGGHTVSNNIVMAFSPRNIVGCFLNPIQTGGGGGGFGGPTKL